MSQWQSVSDISSIAASLHTALSSSGVSFALPKVLDHSCLESNTGSTYDALDKVYHSSTLAEMQVTADLMGVDLRNPYVLWFLAKQTAYHHAFWPHTARRFIAFKSLLRRDKRVRAAIASDSTFYVMLQELYDSENNVFKNSVYHTPGKRQQIKNLEELLQIVEKCIASNGAIEHRRKKR